MEYNHALESFYNSFGEYILSSLNNDYKNSFSFNHGSDSVMSKAISSIDIYATITSICDDLIRNGNSVINYKIEHDSEDGSEFKIVTLLTEKVLGGYSLKFAFPHSIFSNQERKRIIKKLTILNSSELYLSSNGLESMRYAKEMDKFAELEIAKIGNYYFSDDNCLEYYSDYYCIYRMIKHKIAQRKLLNYVLDALNRSFVNSLELKEGDNLLFNGLTIKQLERLLFDLENNKPISEISKVLVSDWTVY